MTPEFFCSSVTTADGALWAVGLHLSRCDDFPEDLSQAIMNIVVTDGIRAWTRDDLMELDMGTVIPNRMRHTLEALVNYSDQPTDVYTVKFTPQTRGSEGSDSSGAPLLVEVEWDNKRHGKDLVYRVHFDLDPAADPAAEIRRVMGGAVDAAAALQAEALRLEESCAGLSADAEAQNKTLDEYAARKEELDGDVALKTAALLAVQQEHLAALLREADAAEEAAQMAADDRMSD